MAIVLLIDDHALVRNGTREFLEACGFNVVAAANGAEGLELADRYRPDVILCDVSMPLMNGYELLEELKKREWFPGTSFYFISALADEWEVKHGIQRGATGFFIKPFDPDYLEAHIAKALAGTRVQNTAS